MAFVAGCIVFVVPALLADVPDEVSDPGESMDMPAASQEVYNSPTNGLGSWIWADTTTDGQSCQFWRAFEVPASVAVSHARLLMTVDNEFTLFLDGRELGRGAEWRELFDFDLTRLMTPGRHVLAVHAFNSFSLAGMILGLRIDLADGSVMEIKSDPNWRVVPEGTKGWETRDEAPEAWPPATVVARFGGRPWWKSPDNVNKMPAFEPITVYFWQTGWFQITLISISGLVILISFQLTAQLAMHRKERRLLERERARIARDIHDDLGSRMTQLVLHGEVARSELPEVSPTHSQLDRICEEAREILSTMDEILWAVNPRRDTLRDFTSFVCGYTQEFLKPTGIECRFEVDPEMSSAALDLPLRRSLLMAIKETLNNTVKHSGASELLLQIRLQGEQLVVVVQDNGHGFDQAAALSAGHGLVNMSQRMDELGGSCTVVSRRGEGCRTGFSVPTTPFGRKRRHWPRLFKRQPREAAQAAPQPVKALPQ